MYTLRQVEVWSEPNHTRRLMKSCPLTAERKDKMRKIVLVILMVCCFSGRVFAEWSIKEGAIVQINKNASLGQVVEVSYEYKRSLTLFNLDKYSLSWGIEPSIGYFQTPLKGEEYNGSWINAEVNRGVLHCFPLGIMGKLYYKNICLFTGVSKVPAFFNEFYEGEAKIKDIYDARIGLEYSINKNWSIVARRVFSDLGIESGSKTIGIAEDDSSLNRTEFLVRFRW